MPRSIPKDGTVPFSTTRRRIPPRGKANRQRYYGLLGAARKAPPHQRAKLLAIARGLMEWVEVAAERGGAPALAHKLQSGEGQ